MSTADTNIKNEIMERIYHAFLQILQSVQIGKQELYINNYRI